MRRSPLARSLTAVAIAALAAGTLAGCTAGAHGSACDPAFGAGDATKAVSVSGDAGSTPVVDFPTPLIAEKPQRSVLEPGDGKPIHPGSTVLADYVYYIGETGEVITENTVIVTAGDAGLALGESLECAATGSRIVVAGPAGDIDSTYDGVSETLVAVVDVRQVFLGKANGVNQLPLDGMPTVVTAVDGAPGIALAYASVPDEARTSTIKAGGGAVVDDGDTIIFHARSWMWPTAEGGQPTIGQLDTWSTFAPRNLDIDASSDDPVQQALAGSRVGSQLLLVVPGADGAQTVIAVFDILGILKK